jgi:2-methylcitrate dehydratase PrpD
VVLTTTAADEERRTQASEGMRALVRWAAECPAEAVADAAMTRAALVLSDDIAAMVAAQGEPEVEAAQTRLTERVHVREATVFNRRAPRVDRYSAAVANGLAATWCELDEGYRVAPAHAGAYVLPALLAEAEATGQDMQEVLRALALGYEIVGRCARAFRFASLTVHPHAAFGTMGAAAGIGLLRGYDAEALLATVSAGATMVFAGPYRHAIEGALVRNLWTGVSAWSGMRAADLAPLGLGGIAASPFDVFAGCFGSDADPAVLTADLGNRWAIVDGYHKLFACCQYAHSAVEASLKLGDRLAAAGRSSDDIVEIIAETHPLGLTLTQREPPTVLSAKFSLPHALAAVAARRTGGQAAFARDTLDDPAIARLRQTVRLRLYEAIGPWPKDRPARVTWRLKDGETWSEAVQSARGGADRPFSTDELIEKIEALTRGVFHRMPDVLRALIALPRSFAKKPWREIVDEMTRHDSAE